MKISKFVVVFFIFVILVFLSSTSALAGGSCFTDFNKYIFRPDPTIEIDFRDPIIYDTISMTFLKYPKLGDGSWDYINPIDKTHLLNEVSFSNNETLLILNLTEDLEDGLRYSIDVSARLQDEEVDMTYYECELYLVDFGELTIEKQSPSNNFISSTTKEMVFETNRNANCFISTSRTPVIRMTNPLSSTGGVRHRNVHPGSDVFYIGCLDLGGSEVLEEFNVILDTTPPSSPVIELGGASAEHSNISTSRNSVRVKFTTSDTVSGIKGVNFTIHEKSTGRNAIAWTSVKANEWVIVTSDGTGTPIQLRDRDVYEIVAVSENNAGLKSSESRSFPFEVYLGFDPDAVPEIDHCKENNVNCPDGAECTENLNCASGFCHPDENICAAPTCNDEILNQDETDVDCGGSCPACEVGKTCLRNSDCLSNNCDIDTMTCAEVVDTSPPPVERPPSTPPPVQDDRNHLMPILVAVFALVLLGGGGYYGYANKDKLVSLIGGGFGSSSLNKSSSSSSAQTQQSMAQQNLQQTQNNAQGSVVATQLSRRLRSKETKRKREDIFEGFSNADSSEKTNISKDDIDNLFSSNK